MCHCQACLVMLLFVFVACAFKTIGVYPVNVFPGHRFTKRTCPQVQMDRHI